MRAGVSSLYEQTKNEKPSAVMGGGWRSLLLWRWDRRRITRKHIDRSYLDSWRTAASMAAGDRNRAVDSDDSLVDIFRLLPRLGRTRPKEAGYSKVAPRRTGTPSELSRPDEMATSIVNGRTKVIVATSVMLSFISFWRAAAIVLNDLGSSAYYVGGIAEQAVGRSAPWFILGVMLFSYAVRAVYVESCAMFTRGGVYRVVKEAMGGMLAKLSVSALMFDYILTGPISGVSAGQYIVGLTAQTVTYFGHPCSPPKELVNLLAAGIAVLITVYFWWRNTKGIHESSDDALKIMYITTVMVILLIGWCSFTILTQPKMH